MNEQRYSIVVDNPEDGAPAVLCHGTSLKEAQEVVAVLSPKYPNLRFSIASEDSRDGLLRRAAG